MEFGSYVSKHKPLMKVFFIKMNMQSSLSWISTEQNQLCMSFNKPIGYGSTHNLNQID